jgi:hypothetical protein
MASRTSRSLESATKCGMTPDRFKEVAGHLARASELDKTWSPGGFTLFWWVLGTAVYWTICGLILKYVDEPSDSDDADVKSKMAKKRNLDISIMLIVYFSLCMLFIILYAWKVRQFQSKGWDSYFPDKSFGGSTPLLTWGLMSLFVFGGLFTSVALVFYFSEHGLAVGIYVLLGLLAIVFSTTVALGGKAWISCGQKTELFNVVEKSCVERILDEYKKSSIQQAMATQSEAAVAAVTRSRLEKSRNLDLATEAVEQLKSAAAQAASQPAPSSRQAPDPALQAALASNAAALAQIASRTS